MKKLLITLGILVCVTIPAHAACTGSGIAFSCPSGASTTDVQNAINSASNNAVITFANGSYTWTGGGNPTIQFSTTKGVTLICAVSATCTINATSTILGITGFTGTLTNLYRISGFTFSAPGLSAALINFDVANPGLQRGTINQIRIDHNTVTATGCATAPSSCTFVFVGDTASYGYYYGVMDHNMVTADAGMAIFFWIGADDPAPPASPQGTANNMFLEDNTLNITLNQAASVPFFNDAWGHAAIVVRHNTILNSQMPVHDLGHAGGPANWEVYNNQFTFNSGMQAAGFADGYRMVHHQGAQEEIFFNNTFAPLTEPHNPNTLSALADYVDMVCPPAAYPCHDQPGRDNAGNLRPIYGWNNSDAVNGTIVATASEEGSTTYVAPNRDLFDAVSITQQTSPTSPFNGTVGVGIGTLANRPTTCTHSNATFPTLVGDGTNGGVGYAAFTTAGTIGASVGEGTASDVVLYHCGATNTWSTWYTPYTYPHPLVGAVPPPPAPATVMFAGQGQIRILGSIR